MFLLKKFQMSKQNKTRIMTLFLKQKSWKTLVKFKALMSLQTVLMLVLMEQLNRITRVIEAIQMIIINHLQLMIHNLSNIPLITMTNQLLNYLIPNQNYMMERRRKIAVVMIRLQTLRGTKMKRISIKMSKIVSQP